MNEEEQTQDIEIVDGFRLQRRHVRNRELWDCLYSLEQAIERADYGEALALKEKRDALLPEYRELIRNYVKARCKFRAYVIENLLKTTEKPNGAIGG